MTVQWPLAKGMDFTQWCGVLIATFVVVVYFIVWCDWVYNKTIIAEHKCVLSARAAQVPCSPYAAPPLPATASRLTTAF